MQNARTEMQNEIKDISTLEQHAKRFPQKLINIRDSLRKYLCRDTSTVLFFCLTKHGPATAVRG